MSVFDALKKLGIKVADDVTEASAKKLLEEVEKGTITRTGKVAEDFGKTTVIPTKEMPVGDIYWDPKGRTGLEELKQAKDQEKVIRHEKMLRDTSELSAPVPEAKKRPSLQELRDQLALIKKGGVAGVAGMAPTDMSPLGDIKGIYDKYAEMRDALAGTAANQMDLTKDKSATSDIKGVLGMVMDPVNYVPGAPGVAASALQMGLEALPKTKLEEMLRNK